MEAHVVLTAELDDEEGATSEGAHTAGRDAIVAATERDETPESPLREFLGEEEERGRGTGTGGSMSASEGGKVGQGEGTRAEQKNPGGENYGKNREKSDDEESRNPE
ncbi:hypothetical protein Nepgr_005303 [Nepenthes gracilis]|uniref:Uncharacterized protein n=1 Tax=Nepenthes gracilis TaxID=150966 RepID=A0AAD3XG60_NEPGR|nr:hypothetical protein Nepgr_005303 [Nepenthes gracilis]